MDDPHGPTGGGAVPSKFDLLMAMDGAGRESGVLLFRGEELERQGDLRGEAEVYDGLLAALERQLELALQHNRLYPDAIEITSIAQSLVTARLRQASTLQSLGEDARSDDLVAAAQALSRTYLGDLGTAETERSRAGMLTLRARYNEALVALASARDTYQAAGDTVKFARTSTDLVNLLHWLGDHERALAELNRVSEAIAPLVAQGPPTLESMASALMEAIQAISAGTGDGKPAENLVELYSISILCDFFEGLIRKDLGQYPDAERAFGRALNGRDVLGPDGSAGVEAQLGLLKIRQGRFEEGAADLERLKPQMMESEALRPRLPALLASEAEAQLGLGNAGRALELLDQARVELGARFDPDQLWRLEWLAGRALEALARPADALHAYRRGADAVDGMRRAPLGYRLDSTFLRAKLPLFESAIRLATTLQDADTCCALIEMVKSRLLTATLSIPPDPGTPRGPDPLAERVDAITREMDALEYAAFTDTAAAERVRLDRDQLLAQRTELLERIRYSDPRWRALTAPVPFNLDAITQDLATRDMAALSLFLLPGEIVSVLLADGVRRVGSKPLSDDLRARVDGFVGNLSAPAPDPLRYDPSASPSIGAEDLIPPDLLRLALAHAALVVVPHGPLHLVPWAGLAFESRRLFEYCPVGVLPNLSCVVTVKAIAAGPPRAALLGAPDYGNARLAPLPGSAEEIASIGMIYGDDSRLIGTVHTGPAATEAAFWSLVNDPTTTGAILHVSCHAILNPVDPMNSGLLLSDSKVDAAEIARARCLFDEVILSGCSTGWRPTAVGDVQLLGDDILGIPGAFLEAGARSILVSVPPALDRAAWAFMVTYHDFRAKGQSPLAALQQTQKAMLAEGRYSPGQWVGFTLYGHQ